MGLNHKSSNLRGVGCVMTIKIRFSKKGQNLREHHVYWRHQPSRHECCTTSLWYQSFSACYSLTPTFNLFRPVSQSLLIGPRLSSIWPTASYRSTACKVRVCSMLPIFPVDWYWGISRRCVQAEHILTMTSYLRIQTRHYFMDSS